MLYSQLLFTSEVKQRFKGIQGQVHSKSSTAAPLAANDSGNLCSGFGTKNVPRQDQTDVVPGWNSTRNSSGTISIL